MKMTSATSATVLSGVVFLSAFCGTAALAAGSTNAALMRCVTGSRNATIRCCEKVLRTHKRPAWMGDGVKCSNLTFCAGSVKIAMSGPSPSPKGKSAKLAQPICGIELKSEDKNLDETKPVGNRRSG